MNANTYPPIVISETAYIITRVFDAPRDLVWKAWTEETHFVNWFAPHGCTVHVGTLDVRTGGVMHFCHRSPDGKEIWAKWVCREVTPPARLVLLDMFSDKDGNTVPASHYGMSAESPLESLMTVTFEEADGKTTVTIHHEVHESVPERKDMLEGWTQIFERLEDYLINA